MKKIFLLALLLSVSFSFSQTSNVELISNNAVVGSNIIDTRNGGYWITSKPTNNKLDGTNYLFSTWFNNAKIYDNNNKGYKLVNCNFNVKLNRIEARLENEDSNKEQVFAFNNRNLTKINIGNKQFVKKNISESQSLLLEIIFNGKKISLYKKYFTNIVEGNIHPLTKNKVTNDRITIKDSYYVQKDGELKEVKLKKSTLLKLMANKKNEVKSYIKDNKLSTSNEADLFKIFQYYNTL